MYTDFYGLKEPPFRLTPDPNYFYSAAAHAKALAYLQYGLSQGQGFVVITGVPGAGKSMLLQKLLEGVEPSERVIAALSNTRLSADEVLQAVAAGFGLQRQWRDKGEVLIALEQFFNSQARAGRYCLLLIDEAQNLSLEALEEIRMLSNFQLDDRPLLQTMLIGQQQLQQSLASPQMEQLHQRIIAACHLSPLTAPECHDYLGYRLQVAGWRGRPSFTAEAVAMVQIACGGIPRLVNLLADRCLLSAALAEVDEVDAALVDAVLAEMAREPGATFSTVESGAAAALAAEADLQALVYVEPEADLEAVPEPAPEVIQEPVPESIPEPTPESIKQPIAEPERVVVSLASFARASAVWSRARRSRRLYLLLMITLALLITAVFFTQYIPTSR